MNTTLDITAPVMTGYDPGEHLTEEGYYRPMRPAGEVIDAYYTASARKQEETAARLWEELLHHPAGIQALRDWGQHDKAECYEAERTAYQQWFRTYRVEVAGSSTDPQLEEGYGYDLQGRDDWGVDEEGWDVLFGGEEDAAINHFTGEGRDAAGYDYWGLDEDGCDRLGHKASPDDHAEYERDGRTHPGRFDRAGYNERGWSKATGRRDNATLLGEGSLHRDTDDIYGPDGYTVSWGVGVWEVARDRAGYKRNGYHHLTNLDREGYDPEGYDAEGYDRQGWDRNGFNREGIHRITGTRFDTYDLDKDGYDANGFKAYHNPITGKVKLLRADGFTKSGVDMDGFNRKGMKRRFSKFTLLHEVTGTRFDEKGLDIRGLTADGCDRWGRHVAFVGAGEPLCVFLVPFEGMPARTRARYELEELAVPREQRADALSA